MFAKYKNDIKKYLESYKRNHLHHEKNPERSPRNVAIHNATVKAKQETAKFINKCFINIGPNLASKILSEQRAFEKYLQSCKTVMNGAPLTNEEVRNTFYSLKTSKSPGYLSMQLMFLTL